MLQIVLLSCQRSTIKAYGSVRKHRLPPFYLRSAWRFTLGAFKECLNMKYLLAVCLAAAVGAVHAESLIRVKGEGQAEVAPDYVRVTGVIYSESKTAQQAKQTADASARAVVRAIKKFKIKDQDLAFSGVSVQRKVEYDRNSNQKIVGFVVNRSITVKLRDLKRYELLAEALTRAGISEIQRPQAAVDDPHALKVAALKQATENARRKAAEIAGGLGVTVGAPYEISEERQPVPMPFNQRRAVRAEMAADGALAGGSYDPLLFVPENIKVDATVWVAFKIGG